MGLIFKCILFWAEIYKMHVTIHGKEMFIDNRTYYPTILYINEYFFNWINCVHFISLIWISDIGGGVRGMHTRLWLTCVHWTSFLHYNDVIMGTMTSQITSLLIVFLIVYSGADQRKHQSSASLAFVRGIHRWPVNSPHRWPVTRKMFPFDDVIMSFDWIKCQQVAMALHQVIYDTLME